MSMAGLPQGAQGQPNLAELIQRLQQQKAGGNAPHPGPQTFPAGPGMLENARATPGLPPGASPGLHNRHRAINDPKKAFGALSKLTKKMNPQQLQQLQQGMGNIFGQNFGGLGAGNQAAEALQNMSDKPAGGGPGNIKQIMAGNKMQQLMASMGFEGPGGGFGGPGINPPGPPPIGINPPGQAPPWPPGGPHTGGPMPPWRPPMGGPMPQPGLLPQPGVPGRGVMPIGPMPGGPGVMGQPSMPGGMQPPVRVNNPGTFFGGQQGPQLNLGAVQGGPMTQIPRQAMAPTMGQPPAASLPAFNNPQYGGTGIR